MQTWQFSDDSRTKPQRAGEQGESPFAATCLQVVDLGLLGIIFIAPLFLGGRHALGRGVFISIVAITAIAWFLRQAILRRAVWPRTWAYLLTALIVVIVAVQIVPLPVRWLEEIAPRNNFLLTLWNDKGIFSLGEWQTISLTPVATKIALATLVAYALLFVVAVGRLRSEADVRHLLRLVAISVILLGGFGLVQLFTSNGRFFWFYECPYVRADLVAKGSFTCRNHFAHFLVLGLGPLFAWLVTVLKNSKSTRHGHSFYKIKIAATLAFCIALVVLAVLLSFSRGGAIVLLVSSLVTVTIYYRYGVISNSHLAGVAALCLLVMGMLSLHGSDQVTRQFNSLTSGSIEKVDRNEGRRTIWGANLAAIQEGGLFGSGAGSHREIYPVYMPKSLPIEYTDAENGYLQIVTQNGMVGAALLAITILTVMNWCRCAVRKAKSSSSLVLAGAVSASLVASLIHSLVDFVWFIPACMSITILLMACALRLAQLSMEDEYQENHYCSFSRLRSAALAACVSIAAIWATLVIARPAWASTEWDRYLIASAEMKLQVSSNLRTGSEGTENNDFIITLSENAIHHLQQVLARNPTSARANVRLAGKYLQLFDLRQRKSNNAMSIDQIREAAISSQFASAHELQEWLNKAFGENSKLLYRAYLHTRRALGLCPLQGEGYLYLANLCFLEGRTQESIDAYLNQSLQVRPHDGQINFEVGRQKLLLGHGENAVAHWQMVFNDPGKHQQQIIQLLAGRISASAFLETFHPEWQTLPYIWKRYRQIGNEDDWLHVLKHGLSTLENSSKEVEPAIAASRWYTLALMQKDLGQSDRALESLGKAYQLMPSYYRARRELGKALLEDEQFHLAIDHFSWCLARKPDDSTLKAELLKAQKMDSQQMARTFNHGMTK